MKHKLIAVLLSISMVMGILTGCAVQKSAEAAGLLNGSNKTKKYEGDAKVKEPDKSYTQGQNEFAYKLFSKLNQNDNLFISPYSISAALSMLYNGADNDTRKEMAGLFGYQNLEGYTDQYNETANNYMNANSKLLNDMLQAADSKVKYTVANSIWMSDIGVFNDSMENALLSPVRYFYNADIFKVDFTQKTALNSINKWVSKKTNGMIDPFISSFSNPEMIRLMLVNAVYFNGKWKSRFNSEDTKSSTFHGAVSDVSVDMMHLYGKKFRYYTEAGMRALELPYGKGQIVMDLIIPEDTANSAIGELYNGLTAEKINQFLNSLDNAGETKIGTLALPRFEMEYGMVNLNETLKELGMKKAFEAGAADFSKIGDDLYVSLVAHKARIKVEEWGTEASAATGITVDTTSVQLDPPVNFIVDVPFIFFIRDTKTDTILFMGQMSQPKK